MKNRIATLTIVLIATFSVGVSAQSPDSVPAEERGRRSVVLALGESSEIGYWWKSNDRMDLGVDFSITGVLAENQDGISVGITPALKRYVGSTGALAPYTYVGVPLRYGRTEWDNTGTPDATDDFYSVGGAVGFGLEWLPTRQVSIGGHVGFGASYSHDRMGNGGTFSLGTQSSGVRVHLYF